MQSKEYEVQMTFGVALIVAFVWFMLAFCVGIKVQSSDMEKAAIEAGVARYHPTTGNFEFVNPNKVEKPQ